MNLIIIVQLREGGAGSSIRLDTFTDHRSTFRGPRSAEKVYPIVQFVAKKNSYTASTSLTNNTVHFRLVVIGP